MAYPSLEMPPQFTRPREGRGKAEYDPILIGLDLARRYLPDHTVNPHELGLAGVHDLWLRNVSDATWGAKIG
jgi:hypothetical protein